MITKKAAAAVACISALVAAGNSAKAASDIAEPVATSQSPSALDISEYDCGDLANIKGATIRHLGQVIDGTYREWFQYHSGDSEGGKLACVLMVVPTSRSLSSAEAIELISKSIAIGVPASVHEHAQESGSQDPVVIPPPMPLPRVTPPDISGGSHVEHPQISPDSNFPVEHRNPNGSVDSFTPPHPPAPSLPNVEHQQTIGVDDRTRSPPTAYPYNTMGYLFVTYPDGQSFSCTGTVISQYVVLTAGHCIQNNNHGGWASNITFYPAQDQTAAGGAVSRPYGGNSNWKTVHTTKGWANVSGPESHPIADYEGDYAAIMFSTPFTYTTTFMPVVFNDTGAGGNSAGYPGTVAGVSNNMGLWHDYGLETSTSTSVFRNIHIREFAVDASPGNSGGPFWVYYSDTGQRAFTGTLSYGDPLNDYAGGPWYDGWNQSLITSWITWTPATDSQPTSTVGSVAGLRVPGVFSSAQTGSQSFIRLFNPTTQAGTVDVTMSDSASGQPLGTWTSPPIPAFAEIQFSISTLESGANKSFTPTNFYSLSVRPTFNGYFQHVLWNRSNGSLTNLTMCDAKVTSNPTLLFGVHSSTLQSGYPSYLVIENTALSSTNVTLGIYDASNGSKLGAFTSPSIPGNGQYIATVASIEAAATPAIKPTASMYHYIVKAETTFQGELQHIMANASSGVVTDLTTYCAMSPAPSS